MQDPVARALSAYNMDRGRFCGTGKAAATFFLKNTECPETAFSDTVEEATGVEARGDSCAFDGQVCAPPGHALTRAIATTYLCDLEGLAESGTTGLQKTWGRCGAGTVPRQLVSLGGTGAAAHSVRHGHAWGTQLCCAPGATAAPGRYGSNAGARLGTCGEGGEVFKHIT